MRVGGKPFFEGTLAGPAAASMKPKIERNTSPNLKRCRRLNFSEILSLKRGNTCPKQKREVLSQNRLFVWGLLTTSSTRGELHSQNKHRARTRRAKHMTHMMHHAWHSCQIHWQRDSGIRRRLSHFDGRVHPAWHPSFVYPKSLVGNTFRPSKP